MTQQLQEQQMTDQKLAFTLGILRAAFQLNVGKQLLLSVPNSVLSDSLHKAKAFTISAIDELVLETYSSTDEIPEANWLVHNPEPSKLLDVARLLDTLARIGHEEKESVYDEFLGLVIDAIVNVYYAQQHRRSIHFAKYKALFKLFADELRADVNRQPGQLWVKEGRIWMQSALPSNNVKLH